LDTDKEHLAKQMLALNKGTREVAKATGVSQSTVSRLKRSKKEEIEAQAARLIDVLPDIIGDIKRDIKTSTTLSKLFAGETEIEDMPLLLGAEPAVLTKFMDLNYKMKSDVLKALGVLPSNAQSVFIQNLYQGDGSSIISDKVMNIIGAKMIQDQEEEDVIDIEAEDE
jgi:transcriptional regulator with XRE-family HTH domain